MLQDCSVLFIALSYVPFSPYFNWLGISGKYQCKAGFAFALCKVPIECHLHRLSIYSVRERGTTPRLFSAKSPRTSQRCPLHTLVIVQLAALSWTWTLKYNVKHSGFLCLHCFKRSYYLPAFKPGLLPLFHHYHQYRRSHCSTDT